MTILRPASKAPTSDEAALSYADTMAISPLSLEPNSLDAADYINSRISEEKTEQNAVVVAAIVDRESTSDNIKILVGPDHQVFIVPRARICAISAYFATTFASASTLQVVLPDIEPGIFQLAIDWLHNGAFKCDSAQDLGLDKLIEIYILGDLIGCHTLKNYTMDLIQDNMYSAVRRGNPGIRLSLNQVRKIFAGTVNAEESPIRTFIAALVSYRLIFGGNPERLEPIFEVPGFLRDFATFQRSSLKEPNGAWYTPVSLREDPRARGFHDDGVTRKGFHNCSFHVHEEGEKCISIGNHDRKRRELSHEDIDY